MNKSHVASPFFFKRNKNSLLGKYEQIKQGTHRVQKTAGGAALPAVFAGFTS
jgi:hypothetical protein